MAIVEMHVEQGTGRAGLATSGSIGQNDGFSRPSKGEVRVEIYMKSRAVAEDDGSGY